MDGNVMDGNVLDGNVLDGNVMDGNVSSESTIVAVSEGETMPTQLAAACVTWDEAWVVYGLGNDCKEWNTWVSPTVDRPGQTLTAQTADTVAIMGHRRVQPSRRTSPEGWVLNVPKNRWVHVPPVPLDNTYELSFIELVDNRLVVAGEVGSAGYIAVFDIEGEAWIETSVAPTYVGTRSAYGVVGNHVVMWSGAGRKNHRDLVFDLGRSTWSMMAEAPIRAFDGMAACTSRDHFVVCGGLDPRNVAGAVYYPEGNRWIELSSVPRFVDRAVASRCVGSELFIFSLDESHSPQASVYNFATREWRRTPRPPLARLGVANVRAFGDNRVIVFGGWDPETELFVRDAALFDLRQNRWQVLPPVPSDVLLAFHPGW